MVLGLIVMAESAAALDAGKVAEEVERAVRAAMTAWAYEAQWTLWEMGTAAARDGIGQHEFAERLRRGGGRPAARRQVDRIRVTVHSATAATAEVDFGLERRMHSEVTDERAVLAMRLEDGRWHLAFYEFLRLAESQATRSPLQNPAVPYSFPPWRPFR
jgi:hypothetical protein